MNEERTAVAEAEWIAQQEHTAAGAAEYTPENIKLLQHADHIRHRPGMYIGDTGRMGMHHLVYELVHNCVDEALAGYCHNIQVVIDVDNSVSVSDDGRGIPVEMHPEIGKPTLEAVLTMVGAGAKFDKGAYKVSAGLHGMGAKAVNALSEWMEAHVQRNGRAYVQEYERGKATTGVKEIGPSKRTGTRIHFKPDTEIFHDTSFDYDTFEMRFRELAFLNKGLAIKLIDKRSGKETDFKYDGGIAEFVEHLNEGETKLHQPPIYLDRTVSVKEGEPGVRVEVALQYTATDEERVRCYTNNAYNDIGGTHLSGFRDALTRTLKAYGTKQDLFKNVTPIGEDFREGLTVIISVQHPEPQFDSQPKHRLNNLEVEGIVSGVVSEHLARYVEENPKEAQKIMKKAVLAAEAREAAQKAKKAMKDRKSILNGGGLPGKLFDCTTRDRDQSELFLVEGQSAGGSAESGRNREYQAILPLRGKPLNVEKARVENMLNNQEITSLISALGIDIGNEQETEEVKKKLRYGKVIILSDADVDGQHIRTLLLTFFYRQMARLVDEGRIYVARPPLYKVTEKKDNIRFVQTAEEMHEELMARGRKNARLVVIPPPVEGAEAPAPRVTAGDDLAAVLKVMVRMEIALETLERRGVNLAEFVKRATENGLPVFRVSVAGREEWCFTRAEVDALRQREQERLGRELVVEDEVSGTNGHGGSFRELELHEIHKVNQGLAELRRFGLAASDLVPALRIAGREPPPRLRLESGDHGRPLEHLRILVTEVRRLGEKGLAITRFKGLGEMGADELWQTTLDPEKRTLMQVQLDDAFKADEMFRTLMGEKVEPRREFIQKYALDVKEIDYHGA
jgi:DNA gyrase subunit B